MRAVGYAMLSAALAIASMVSYSERALADLSNITAAGRDGIFELDVNRRTTMTLSQGQEYITPSAGVFGLIDDTNYGAGYAYMHFYMMDSAGDWVVIGKDLNSKPVDAGYYAGSMHYVPKGCRIVMSSASRNWLCAFTPVKN
jgi:hypothetical protein